MNMIFPGMDPYLEDPEFWHGFHQRFIVYLSDLLQPKLSPRYIAAVEERVYVEGPNRQIEPDLSIRWRSPRPEVEDEAGGVAVLVEEADDPMVVVAHEIEVRESYIAILDRKNGLSVVTILEVVSPGNKCVGPGRRSYVEKQAEILRGDTHLVEVDLLRVGPHVLAVPQSEVGPRVVYDYLTSVNRSRGDRSIFEVYPTLLRRRLPRIRLPLAEGDADVVLDIQAGLVKTYESGIYRARLRYDRPCVPPLSPDDQAWADGLIREASGA